MNPRRIWIDHGRDAPIPFDTRIDPDHRKMAIYGLKLLGAARAFGHPGSKGMTVVGDDGIEPPTSSV